ncbi:MAG: hypothetical protein PHY36_00780 [Methanocellales archaeon]|nr:hypothetical protein [Methanocellales archaeon]MDD5446406.1 hypothetical protein [Methanocellales archaeon]
MRIFKRGVKKAVETLGKSEAEGTSIWVPQLKQNLKDSDYVFWLGMVW